METGQLLMVQEIINQSNTGIKKLSIQVRLDGFSFCMLTCAPSGNEIIWYKKLSFPKEHNPVKLLEKIEIEYKNEKQLENRVEEVVVLFSNELYSIVPAEFFREEEASNYLKFNTKILKTDVVAHDVLSSIDLVNVYIPYTNITNYFFDKYGEYEYKHSISVFIQEVMELSDDLGDVAYLSNYNGYYDLVVLRNNKLLLSNTFSYTTPEDFIYYLLFTAEQLNLDPNEFKLILIGEITKESLFFEITYTYIKNVEFLDLKWNIDPGEYSSDKLLQEEFVLLKSLGCE